MKRRLTLLAVALLSAIGCDLLSPSASVTYRVSGSAAKADVTYAGSKGSTNQQAGVTLPWSTTVTINKKDDDLYLSAQNATNTGCVDVDISHSGKSLYSGSSCGAFTIATASGGYK